jgi:transposase
LTSFRYTPAGEVACDASRAGGGKLEPFIGVEQFERVYGLLRQERKIHTKEREKVRAFLEAVFWVTRSGAQWRFLPGEYGEWNSVYQRFARWDDLGVWGRLFDQVADAPDLQAVLIDATVVRAHACAAGAPKKTAGRRRRGSGARAAASAPRFMPSSTRSATR